MRTSLLNGAQPREKSAFVPAKTASLRVKIYYTLDGQIATKSFRKHTPSDQRAIASPARRAWRRIAMACAIAIVALPSFAQVKQVNESCSQVPCESGLYCVETRKGDKKCATCDQSTLNDLSAKVDDCCKTSDKAWSPESNEEYLSVRAADGRVLVDIFDKLLENAKKCRDARKYREERCWKGGDDEHLGAIKQIEESISRIADHKSRMINTKLVYYGSKSSYESRLSTFQSKSRIDLPDIEKKLNDIEKDLNDGKKVNCSDIERYSNDCERCYDASKDLLSDGFGNSMDKFPGDYAQILNKSQELMKRAKDLQSKAKDKSLCN